MQNITNFDFKELNVFNKIYVLVSGGIDSTYLYEIIKQECDNKKIYPVNCFNPLENNETLSIIEKDTNFIRIKPNLNNNEIHQLMIDCFKKVNYAKSIKNGRVLTKKGKKARFSKNIFQCCSILKHKMFLNNELFREKNTCVISGIKLKDGFQRNQFLSSLKDGKTRTKGVKIEKYPTFYYQHKGGQLYCYPFRDYQYRELPHEIIDELKLKYPNLHHTGCGICPILVVFENRIRNRSLKNNDIYTLKRINESIKFYNKISLNQK